LATAFAAVKSNPKFVRWHSHDIAFRRVDAVFSMANDQPRQALAAFDTILANRSSPGTALEQAKSLSAFGYPELALRHLDDFLALPAYSGSGGIGMPRIHVWVLHEQGWWSRQLTEFREHLETTIRLHPTMGQGRDASPQVIPTSSPHASPST
jgi:hypothetical protein